jgi:hypothetical protein
MKRVIIWFASHVLQDGVREAGDHVFYCSIPHCMCVRRTGVPLRDGYSRV